MLDWSIALTLLDVTILALEKILLLQVADKQLKQTLQKVGKETVLVISNTGAEMREYVGSNQTLLAILIMCGRQCKELLVANI